VEDNQGTLQWLREAFCRNYGGEGGVWFVCLFVVAAKPIYLQTGAGFLLLGLNGPVQFF